VEHDWFAMFSAMGVLEHDIQIALIVRIMGWIGIFAATGWLVWQAWAKGARQGLG